jgi:hypothetical protein
MIPTVSILTARFYEIVDRQYASNCVLDSHIVHKTLKRLGLRSRLQPCQLAFDSGQRSFMIGFTGLVRPGQWDGHVAVKIDDLLIDCGTGSLAKYFGANVPRAITTRCLQVKSHRIAWLPLNDTERLIWLDPPDSVDSKPPEPPLDLVRKYSEKLSEIVKRERGNQSGPPALLA